MKVDIVQILEMFDEVLPLSNEEQGVYWFQFTRTDEIFITFVVSLYQAHVGVIVNLNKDIELASYSFENCSEIRIVDMQRKCLEIICAPNFGRCVLSLVGERIADYAVADNANK